MQAFLPITSGGLGLSNAQLASEPAYVAAWVDYLRFVRAHPSLFPSVHTLLTPASLATSSCPSIAALREAYDNLSSNLERDDPALGAISGDVEMRAILGEHVSGVESLHLARAKPQRALTHAVLATAERNWRLDASRADCTRLTDASGPEPAWVTTTTRN